MSAPKGTDAIRKFQAEMKKLGLGVSIQVGDDPPVVICDPPESEGEDTQATKGKGS